MVKTKSIKAVFTGNNGHRLDARLELPLEETKAFIIFSHCFTCTKDIITAYRSSRILAKHGYAVLRFDFSGLGDSEGDFANCNFSTSVEDINGAIDYLTDNYSAPSILIGHSLGGTSSLASAINNDCITKIITIASPSQPAHVLHHFGNALHQLEQDIPASIAVAGTSYDINPQFVNDVRAWDMSVQLQQLNKSVLIFNVENDAVVGAKNANELQQWIAGETLLIDLHDTDHILSSKQANAIMVEKMIVWIETS